ncbi:MAG: hypothetical protein Q7T20_15270 [Saprospiraceae bacterium]|nr:hypothetical protein [Saprospiraceae bacterium]
MNDPLTNGFFGSGQNGFALTQFNKIEIIVEARIGVSFWVLPTDP